MKKNLLALGVTLTLSMAASSAFAGVKAYGSYEIGRADSKNDSDTLVPYAYDANLPGAPVQYVGHGDGMNHNFRVGVKFDLPIFVEFATGRGVMSDKAQYGVDSATGACNVEPTLGLIDDCWNQANISQRTELRNMELVAGWRFDFSEKTHLSPYIGARKVKVNDTRFVDYNYIGGVSDKISDESFFDEQGWVAGVRFEQDFQHFFINAELQYSRAKGDRSRNVLDTEYDSASLATTNTDTSSLIEDVTVRQRMGRIGIGKRFDMLGMPSNVSLGYQLSKADGFDTRSTETNTYNPGQLGNGDVELESKGLFLRFEINN